MGTGRRDTIRRAVAVALASAGLAATVGDASAYCRTTTCDAAKDDCRVDENGCTRDGAPLTWRTLPIVYRFHSRGSQKLEREDAREAVRAGFQRWSDVACGKGQRTSLRFKEEEDIRSNRPMDPRVSGAEHLGVYFRDDGFNANDADHKLALTTHTFGLLNGIVDHADIEVNTSTATFATSEAGLGIDLQAVLTHEVGHYIGLAHSRDAESIMVHDYCQSSVRCASKVDARRLSDDDRAAVCALFPPSGASGVRFEESEAGSCAAAPVKRSGAARSSNREHGATWLPLAAGAFVLAALRRRWRRRAQ